ncbi:MAG TPA: MBL fold metallo-hydrolase [Acidobacteriota bacterium]|nr:MBL fold metallo-hydrolase [Acidobacteriota bacterium]
MKKPFLQGQEFLDDVKAAARQTDRLHIWWLGQSGFLVLWEQTYLLVDPYLSDSLTEKYAATDKPHVRMTERVVAPGDLAFVDIVTSSHNHTDHLDAKTIQPLLAANPSLQVIVGAANRHFAAERLQVATDRLTPITSRSAVEIGPFTFYSVPAAHETLETDEEGNHRFIGLIIEAGPWTLYHAGDTVLYPGMAQYLAKWQVDVALLPINGRSPERWVPGNLSAQEAVQLGKAIDAGLVVPCHYDMFEFNTVSPDEFETAARAAKLPYRILQNGERLSLP